MRGRELGAGAEHLQAARRAHAHLIVIVLEGVGQSDHDGFVGDHHALQVLGGLAADIHVLVAEGVDQGRRAVALHLEEALQAGLPDVGACVLDAAAEGIDGGAADLGEGLGRPLRLLRRRILGEQQIAQRRHRVLGVRADLRQGMRRQAAAVGVGLLQHRDQRRHRLVTVLRQPVGRGLPHVFALVVEGFGQLGDGGLRVRGDAAQGVRRFTADAFILVAERLDHLRRGALRLGADPAQRPDGVETGVVVLGLQHLRERRDRVFADLAEGDGGVESQILIVGFEGGDQFRHRRRRGRAEIRQAHDRLHPSLRVRAVQLLHELVQDDLRVALGYVLSRREGRPTEANYGGEAQELFHERHPFSPRDGDEPTDRRSIPISVCDRMEENPRSFWSAAARRRFG